MIGVEGTKLRQFAGKVREGQHDGVIARILVGIGGSCLLRAGSNRIGKTVTVLATARSSSGGSSSSESCHLLAGFSGSSELAPNPNRAPLRALWWDGDAQSTAKQQPVKLGRALFQWATLPSVDFPVARRGPDGPCSIKCGQGRVGLHVRLAAQCLGLWSPALVQFGSAAGGFRCSARLGERHAAAQAGGWNLQLVIGRQNPVDSFAAVGWCAVKSTGPTRSASGKSRVNLGGRSRERRK